MAAEKIHAHLEGLKNLNNSIRAMESHDSVNRVAAAVDTLDGGGLAGLAAELATPDAPQRFGPLLYSLRSIYAQLAETRAMVDVGRLAEWADATIAGIERTLNQPEQLEAAATVPTIPEGAREFVIFESLARPGYRVACYHTGDRDELFGLDGRPRVPPDPTKWQVVAYTKLPAGRDLIPPAAMELPGDDGEQVDWNTAPLAMAPAPVSEEGQGEATAIKIEGHPPAIELVPAAESAPVGESQPAGDQSAGQ